MDKLKKLCKDKSIDFFFPIAFIITIVPLIVRQTTIKLTPAAEKLNGVATKTDLFSQKKALFLLIFSVILLLLIAVFFKKIFSKKDKIVNIILISSFVFLLLTLLSAIFSSYKGEAFFGFYNRSEGFITICCYFILLIYSIYAFKKTDDFKYITVPLIIIVFIDSFLGLFQYLGEDLIKTKLGILLTIPLKDYNPNMKMNLLFESGKLYGTTSNYNYIGSLIALIIPVLIFAFIYELKEGYKAGYKFALLFAVILCPLILLGSSSRGGLIGVFMSILFAVIVFFKQIKKKWKGLLIFIAVIAVLLVGLNFISKGKIFSRIPQMGSDFISLFKTSDKTYKDTVPIKDIKSTDSGIEVTLQNDILKMAFNDGKCTFTDSNDKTVEYIFNSKNGVISTTDERFKSISFKYGALTNGDKETQGLVLLYNNQNSFYFKHEDDDTLKLFDMASFTEMELKDPPYIGFKGKETIGSARGYIWSRSLPLLKENILLGSGADTFIYRFPQDDLIGKLAAYNTTNMMVDKPHNLYLKTALDSGVIALIAFLIIMLTYIIDSFKLYAFKEKYSRESLYGIGTFLGIVGYLFTGIFNDSVVSVAPIFYVLLGTGIAINYVIRKQIRQ
ncbi:O-antigen ligase family protein [Clostridium sp. BJN0001]|uniref:O-antigen ligase family protein n=1 Tax=Clostridium sp. BJN0001 TaxID=2930219 RepID=UPI001FD3AA07|nr:O-antigen ligase family protein [Clostridium sp. BJN0001]